MSRRETRPYAASVGLVGRRAELSLVTERLRDRRLVTLVGPGGIGKTSLARAAADACAPEFGEGAPVVDLTRVDSADGVRESLAAQLGYSSFTSLLDSPGDHSVLVVVDNCEHVVDAVADAVGQLLAACQMPTVLATSRSALELVGEVVVPIGPLELPPVGSVDGAAVRLFLERASEAGVELDATPAVAELCRRLDGVPLAIELAAARCRALTPEEILERLQAGLDVLDRPRRRVAPRHQSLRATIAWSHDLLAPEERRLFDRLAVFPGPFSAELAHAVAGDPAGPVSRTADLLDALVATSMVVAEPAGAVTRYRQLETLRAFARERLDASGDRRAVESRFVDHVVDRATDIMERGAASWSADALADLLGLYESLAAAVRWCLSEDDRPDRAFLLVAVLWGVVHQAHTEEVGSLAEQVLGAWKDADHPLRADVVAVAATCRYMLGDHAAAVTMAEAALVPSVASPFAPATLRRAIAQSLRAAGDTEAALSWFDAAAVEARRAGLVALAVEADAARAQILADLGSVAEALALVAGARAEAESAGAEVAMAWTRCIEGSVLLRTDPARASAVLEHGLAECRRLAYAAGVSANLRSLAFADLLAGDHRRAASRVLELLDDLLGRGSTYELRLVFDAASAVLRHAGLPDAAADLAATALALPVVSITASVGHELFPLDPAGGEVLSAREGILATRAALDAVVAGTKQVVVGPAALVDERVGVFRRAGEYWEVGFAGATATIRATKGMADLGTLLGAAGREVHCLELIGAGVEEGGTGEVLDATARRAYEDRVRALQAELDDAEADHDRGRAERARAELDAVVDQLVAGLGLGGRSRSSGGAAERARSAVTQRIRATIKRIGEVHPALGRHLQASIRTGTFCSYEPEHPVRWQR